MKMKKQSFVTGAIILMIANAISKILGAVFKIPLTYILKEEGMAIYNSAFQIYALFLSFVIIVWNFEHEKVEPREFFQERETMTVVVVAWNKLASVGSNIIWFETVMWTETTQSSSPLVFYVSRFLKN